MTISPNTQDKMKSFARNQAESYLNEAEMTYMEKLRRKAGNTKSKMHTKITKFKNSSERSKEARDDLLLYMHDYMEDLISQGMSEEMAFEKAKNDLTVQSDTKQYSELHEHFQHYYMENPKDMEAIGLLYGGFTLLGLGIGSLTGFLASGGVETFLQNGWIYTLVGLGTGILAGTSLALISNAIIISKKK